ncbi:hypothetical protein FOL47_007351 [Perkinsus chesapeaki]|uniref:Cyclin-dependent kinase 2 homolog n=1 Tax=Perkinsus chesapeaki TaxID=330153 RepID=A0A7J6LLL2_PERCH|nr:hypothetical protein FOL47_007351 [Perkinsus chesapeaki]
MPYDLSSATIPLTSIPTEVLLYILASLDISSLCKAQLSCRSLWCICDALIEGKCTSLWSRIVIAPITLGPHNQWITAYQQQQAGEWSWRAKARTMQALSHLLDECPKLFMKERQLLWGQRGFSFDYRSARIASKRLSFTVTTLLGIHPTGYGPEDDDACNDYDDDRLWLQVSIQLRFNKDAAGNVLVGFCDSITNENLTVDRSRSVVCGKGIAIEPISGDIYTMGNLIESGIPSVVDVNTTTTITDNSSSSTIPYNVIVGVCMSSHTGDIVFLRRLSHWPKGQWIPTRRCALNGTGGLYSDSEAAAAIAAVGVVNKVWYPCICCHALTESSRLNAEVIGFEMLCASELWGRFSDSTLLEGIPVNSSTTTAAADTVLISSSTLKGSSLSDLWSLPSLTAAAAPLARRLCDVIDAIYQSAGVHGHPFLDVEVRLNDNLDTRGPQCVMVGGVGIMNEDKVDIIIPINKDDDEDKMPNSVSSSSSSSCSCCIPQYNHVLFAGTFDHLHVGHRAVITRSFLMANKTLRLALVAGELLKNKRLAKALQPFDMREREVLRFVKDIRPTHWHCDVEVIPDITKDPIGPARTLKDFDCLVVTTETAKGGAIVNKARKEAGNPEVDIVEVNLRSHGSAAADGGGKVSSTDVREYICDKAGGEDKLNNMYERWYKLICEDPLITELGCDDYHREQLVDTWWSTLRDLYLQPWRYYHTLNHVREVLDNIYSSREGKGPLPADVAESDGGGLEICAWFHDSIYVPGLNDNEKASERLWVKFCDDIGIISPQLQEEVSKTILATENHVTSRKTYPVEAYPSINAFLDLDLLILASDWPRYKEYAHEIRQEYEPVVGGSEVFAQQRSTFLSSVCNGNTAMFALSGLSAEEKARSNMRGLWCAFAGFTLGNAVAEWTIKRRDREKELVDDYEEEEKGRTEATANTDITSASSSSSLSSIGMDVGVNTDDTWGRYVIEASDLLVAVVACDGRAVGFGTLDTTGTMEDPSLSMTSVVRCKFRPADTAAEREGTAAAAAAGSGELSFQIFYDPTENYLRYVSKFDLSSADLPDEVIAYTAASWNSTMRYCRLTQCGGPGGGGTGPSDGMNLDMVSTVPQYFATQTHAIEWLARLTKVFMSSITRCLLHIRDCRNGSMPFATKDMLEANTVLSMVPTDIRRHEQQQHQQQKDQVQPRERVRSTSSSCEDKFCPICLEQFLPGELVRRLPCMHVFHKTKTCDVDKHLKRNKQCPTCKTPIDISYDYLLTIPHDTAAIIPPEQPVEEEEEGGIVPTNEMSEQVADLERMLGGLRESLNNYERMRRAVHAFYHTSIDSNSDNSNQIEEVPIDHQRVVVNNENHRVDPQDCDASNHPTDEEVSLAPLPSTETTALLPSPPQPLLLLPPASSSPHDATASDHTTTDRPDEESCGVPCSSKGSSSSSPYRSAVDSPLYNSDGDLEYGSGEPTASTAAAAAARAGFDSIDIPPPPSRDFAVDWIRAGSIYAVVFVHTTVTVQWSVKNLSSQELEKIQVLIRQYMQFGLGLFYWVSGAACGHSKDTFWSFLLKRSQRLLIPLLVGYFLVVVPDAYISRSWRYEGEDDNIGFFHFYWSTISTFRDGVGWLWFLPALWFLSLINYPIIAWFNNPNHDFSTNSIFLTITALVCLFGLGGCILAFSEGPSWTRCLCAIPVWLPYAYTILFPIGRRLFTIACSLILVLVMFGTGVGDRTDLWSNMTFSILFYNYWYLYGIIYTFAGHTQEEARYYPHFSHWITAHRPFGYTLMPESFRRLIGTAKAFILILLASISTPTHRENVGYYWRFPLYNTWGLVMLYVIGGWCWFLLVVYAAMFLDGGLNTDFPSTMVYRQSVYTNTSQQLPTSSTAYSRLSTSEEPINESPLRQTKADLSPANGDGGAVGRFNCWAETLAGHAEKSVEKICAVKCIKLQDESEGGGDAAHYHSSSPTGCLGGDLIKNILRGILHGVAYLHSHKILHRDLKPQNILLNSDCTEIRIADFGLAREIGIPTGPLAVDVVTLWYRAPEALLGSTAYAEPLDVWSIGCILLEMLRGAPLVTGSNPEDQICRLFAIFGAPDDTSWPGVCDLPRWKSHMQLVSRVVPLQDLVPPQATSAAAAVDMAASMLNLSWRDKTPVRKVFNFLRRSLGQSVLSNKKLYLMWKGDQILAHEDVVNEGGPSGDITLQRSLAEEFTKAVTKPFETAFGAHDTAVICTLVYGLIKEDLRDIAIQTEHAGGVDTLHPITSSVNEGVGINKSVQVDSNDEELLKRSSSSSTNNSVSTAAAAIGVTHGTKKKSKGKKGDDKKDEPPQKRKRRPKKGDGKGVAKKRRKTNDISSLEGADSVDVIEELPKRKGELGNGKAKETSSEIEKPTPCKGSEETGNGRQMNDKTKGKSSSEKVEVIEDSIKEGDSRDQHIEGLDTIAAAAAAVSPLTHLICHIPEDEPIEVDYGGEEEEEGYDRMDDVVVEADDDKSITFEEPPNGDDLFEDEEEVKEDDGVDNTNALEQEDSDSTDVRGGASGQSTVVLRPRPRPLSLSSIISDCRPIEDEEDRAEMEASPPISAGDLEGVVITPSDHPPQTTRGAPPDDSTQHGEEEDTQGSLDITGPGQNYLQVRASVIAQGRG